MQRKCMEERRDKKTNERRPNREKKKHYMKINPITPRAPESTCERASKIERGKKKENKIKHKNRKRGLDRE